MNKRNVQQIRHWFLRFMSNFTLSSGMKRKRMLKVFQLQNRYLP